jgi:hypothetical protein
MEHELGSGNVLAEAEDSIADVFQRLVMRMPKPVKESRALLPYWVSTTTV